MSHNDKGGVFVGLLLLALWGVIRLVAFTWPYSLWLALFLLFSTIAYFGVTRRRKLKAAISTASTEGAVQRLRGRCAALCLVISAIGIVASWISAQDLQFIYYLSATLVFATAWFHLKKLETEPEEKSAGELKLFPGRSVGGPAGKTEAGGHTLAFHVYKATRNYLLLITAVSLALVMANLYLSQIPTNHSELRELRAYEEGLARTRAFFEALKLSPFRAVALLVALWCVRMAELKWSGLTRVVDRSWRLLKPTLKIVEKCATVLGVAASFTFLGTGGHGVITSFSAHIKEAEATYTDFRRKADEAANRLVTKELTTRSWKEQPLALRNGLEEAAKLLKEMDQHRAQVEAAEARYGVREASPPVLEQIDTPPMTWRLQTNSEPPPDSLSVDSARSALEAAEQFNEMVKTSGGDDLNDELASKTIEALSPLNHVEEFMSHLGDFADHWPVVAEYGSTLVNAFNDWGFQKAAREFKAKLRETMLGGKAPGVNQARAEAALVAERVEINWSRYTPGWLRQRRSAMERNRESLAKADLTLQASAREAQIRHAQEVSVTISKRSGQLDAMGRALSDFKLEALSAEMERARTQLIERTKYWPPLGDLSPSQILELKAILKPLESDWSETDLAVGAYMPPAPDLPETPKDRFNSAAIEPAEIPSAPLESGGGWPIRGYSVPAFPSYESNSPEEGGLMRALRWLEEYGQERALLEIAKNYNSAGGRLLRERMGPAFVELSGLYEQRVRAEQERRVEAWRRARATQEAARERARIERQRETELRERIRERAEPRIREAP